MPLIATRSEFDLVKAASTRPRNGDGRDRRETEYQVGTMIELPAPPMAGEIAETAEFFSFGTNDLTQTTYGISRDDTAGFLGTYIAKGIHDRDHFRTPGAGMEAPDPGAARQCRNPGRGLSSLRRSGRCVADYLDRRCGRAGRAVRGGRLLRELDWAQGELWLGAPVDIATAPVYPIRGHQLGYRAQANSYDAWDAAQFETVYPRTDFFRGQQHRGHSLSG